MPDDRSWRPPPADAPGAKPPGQAVLVVDDEADIVDSLSQLLEEALPGLRIIPATSGEQGLQHLKTNRVDLIITDYKMPGMNGLEFIARARDLAPQAPRILITAYPDLQIALRAINEAEIDKFFTKPFDGKEVISAVRAILFDKKTKDLMNESVTRALRRHDD